MRAVFHRMVMIFNAQHFSSLGTRFNLNNNKVSEKFNLEGQIHFRISSKIPYWQEVNYMFKF